MIYCCMDCSSSTNLYFNALCSLSENLTVIDLIKNHLLNDIIQPFNYKVKPLFAKKSPPLLLVGSDFTNAVILRFVADKI